MGNDTLDLVSAPSGTTISLNDFSNIEAIIANGNQNGGSLIGDNIDHGGIADSIDLTLIGEISFIISAPISTPPITYLNNIPSTIQSHFDVIAQTNLRLDTPLNNPLLSAPANETSVNLDGVLGDNTGLTADAHKATAPPLDLPYGRIVFVSEPWKAASSHISSSSMRR